MHAQTKPEWAFPVAVLGSLGCQDPVEPRRRTLPSLSEGGAKSPARAWSR